MSDNKFIDLNGAKIIYKYALEKAKQYMDERVINSDDEKINAVLSEIAVATESVDGERDLDIT